MGLDTSMVFVTKEEDKLDLLIKYFESLTLLYGKCGINVDDVGSKQVVDDYFCIKVEFRNTYCSEVIEKIYEDSYSDLLTNMIIFHQSTEDTDYSYVDFTDSESLRYIYVSDYWDCKACDVGELSGSLIDRFLIITGLYRE